MNLADVSEPVLLNHLRDMHGWRESQIKAAIAAGAAGLTALHDSAHKHGEASFAWPEPLAPVAHEDCS